MKTLIVSDPSVPTLRQVPDSALLTGGRPLFLQEGCTGARLVVMPAVRICRLGLSIGRRFARRYYDAATLVALNAPSDSLCDADLVADNALITGTWLPLPDTSGPWKITAPDGSEHTFDIAGAFDTAIESISRRTTFKTGDIVALRCFFCVFDAMQESRPQWSLNGTDVLSFKIK